MILRPVNELLTVRLAREVAPTVLANAIVPRELAVPAVPKTKAPTPALDPLMVPLMVKVPEAGEMVPPPDPTEILRFAFKAKVPVVCKVPPPKTILVLALLGTVPNSAVAPAVIESELMARTPALIVVPPE